MIKNRVRRLILLAAGLSIGALGCGQQRASNVSSAPQTSAPDGAADGAGAADWQLTRKEEIRAAWDRIGELRASPKLGLPREPVGTFTAPTSLADLRQCVEGPEEPEVSEGCSDVCNIKDAICDNAEDICRIASELDGDAWAADKCNSAKASCKEAKEICCGCIDAD